MGAGLWVLVLGVWVGRLLKSTRAEDWGSPPAYFFLSLILKRSQSIHSAMLRWALKGFLPPSHKFDLINPFSNSFHFISFSSFSWFCFTPVGENWGSVSVYFLGHLF